MSLRCLIIDDQLYAIELIHRYIDRHPKLEFVDSETDPTIALSKLLSGEIKVDLIFLDIDMPEMSGMDLAALVKGYAMIAFITAHEKYAVQSYEHGVLDYMLKPVTYERFSVCIDKAIEKISGKSGNVIDREKYFFVPGDRKGKLIKIVKDDVLFIEAAKNYLIIHLTTGNVITYLTISAFEDEVTYEPFMRIHRSFIVNINRIKSKDNSMIFLDNNMSVIVGRTYHTQVEERLRKLVVSNTRRDRPEEN